MSTTRQQVMALIVGTMAQAMKDGKDPWSVAAKTFPGTPYAVLGEAFGEASCAEVEAWWQQVEHTIDAEVVRSALHIRSTS